MSLAGGGSRWGKQALCSRLLVASPHLLKGASEPDLTLKKGVSPGWGTGSVIESGKRWTQAPLAVGRVTLVSETPDNKGTSILPYRAVLKAQMRKCMRKKAL